MNNTAAALVTENLAGKYLVEFAGVTLPQPALIEELQELDHGVTLTVWINGEMIEISLNPDTRVALW